MKKKVVVMDTPAVPTLAYLEVVVMPNGEVLCLGKTVGWISAVGGFLSPKKDA